MLWSRGATREDRGDLLLDVFALSLAATLVVSVADHLYDRVLLVPALLCLGRLHRAGAVTRLSAAGLGARLVVATLALVLGGGAVLGLQLQFTTTPLARVLTDVTLLGYAVLPLVVWLALTLAIATRADATRHSLLAGTARAESR